MFDDPSFEFGGAPLGLPRILAVGKQSAKRRPRRAPQQFPSQPSGKERRARARAAAGRRYDRRPITKSRIRRVTAGACGAWAIDAGDPAAIAEQVALDQHGIAQLRADFLFARARRYGAARSAAVAAGVGDRRAASSPDTIA